MGLYRRKDSPFLWMSFRTPQGRIFESTHTINRRLAERIHAKRLTEITEGRFFKNRPAEITNTNFEVLAGEYLTWATRQRAFRSKKGFVGSLLRYFGPRPLNLFTTKDVEDYQAHVIARERTPATVNRHVACLLHMFTKAHAWCMVHEATLTAVRRADRLEEPPGRLRYLSTEECGSLIEACQPHLSPIVITALNTGMRKEEILSLEWEKHVDLKNGVILLDRTKNGRRREVPINRTLRDTLNAIVRKVHCPFVFSDERGRRYRDVKRSFRSALRRAGVKDFRFHDLRHTFASLLRMKGVDLATIRDLLGHRSITMTLRYAHLAPGHTARAVEVLDGPGYDMVTLPVRNVD